MRDRYERLPYEEELQPELQPRSGSVANLRRIFLRASMVIAGRADHSMTVRAYQAQIGDRIDLIVRWHEGQLDRETLHVRQQIQRIQVNALASYRAARH